MSTNERTNTMNNYATLVCPFQMEFHTNSSSQTVPTHIEVHLCS